MTSITVVFDGQCALCTRTVKRIQKWDRHGRITWRPCQSIPPEGWEDVSPAECAKVVWAVDAEGNRAQGSDAAMMILAALIDARWPMTIGRLPVVHQVMQGVYWVIARNRRRFPGETPWCEQHPADCRPSSNRSAT